MSLSEVPCDFCGEPLGTRYLSVESDAISYRSHVHERCLERYKAQLVREVLMHNAQSR